MPLPTPSDNPGLDAGSTGSPTAEPDPADFNLVDGEVVRWDACGPIYWVVRQGPGPDDARQIAEQALQQVADATGLTFQFAGETNRLVRDSSDGAADRTIYISWATPDEVPILDGLVAGVGGASYRSIDGVERRPINGSAVVDVTEGLTRGFDGSASEGAVLLHELGHVLGLAHVDDPDRLMYPTTDDKLSGVYQPGDLAALAAAVDPRPCG